MEKVQNCSIFNYADDNTISAFHSTIVYLGPGIWGTQQVLTFAVESK